MSVKDKLNEVKEKLEAQILETKSELEQLEKDLSDQKLNPYGITNIDFSKRLELMEDLTKMQGCIMGLNLAIEVFDEEVTV